MSFKNRFALSFQHMGENSNTVEPVRWHERTILDQLGNIGAEAGRAIQAKERNDLKRLEGAWYRMDLLFYETIDDPRWRQSRRLREILYAREVTYSFLEGSNPYAETAESLERYWMEWGILANRERKGVL